MARLRLDDKAAILRVSKFTMGGEGVFGLPDAA